jgi:hypothetical protein
MGALSALPICRSRPVRESHAQVVKSSKLESEWYSFQTSQRPSKLPSAWSFRVSVNRLIGL